MASMGKRPQLPAADRWKWQERLRQPELDQSLIITTLLTDMAADLGRSRGEKQQVGLGLTSCAYP